MCNGDHMEIFGLPISTALGYILTILIIIIGVIYNILRGVEGE